MATFRFRVECATIMRSRHHVRITFSGVLQTKRKLIRNSKKLGWFWKLRYTVAIRGGPSSHLKIRLRRVKLRHVLATFCRRHSIRPDDTGFELIMSRHVHFYALLSSVQLPLLLLKVSACCAGSFLSQRRSTHHATPRSTLSTSLWLCCFLTF